MMFSNMKCLLFFAVVSLIEATYPINPKDPGLPRLFGEFLSAPIVFADEVEESKCNTTINALSAEEQHLAARTSYAYWYLEEETDTPPSTDLQRLAALREIRRHLIASDGDVQKTIERVKTVCEYRKEHQLDLLRIAFSDDVPSESCRGGDIKNITEVSSSSTQQKMRQFVESDMAKQPVIMKCADSRARAVMFKFPRRSGGTTEQEYLTTQLYIAERANAVIEYISQGRQEKMVAVFDFSNMRSSYSPNLQWQISAIRAVQLLYPERLYKLVILEPPLWIRGLYISIRPFLSKATSSKIQVVSDRSKLCGDVLDCEDGDGVVNTLNEEVDLDHYLNKIPFFCPHDCEPYGYTTTTTSLNQ